MPHRTLALKAMFKPAAAFFVFAAAVLLLAFLPQPRAPRPAPPGWTIVRPPEDVMALAIAGDRVWAGGKEGVMVFDRRTAAPLTAAPPGNFAYTRALLLQGDILWIGHEKTLTAWDGKARRDYTEADGLPPGRILCLMLDKAGRLWVGTDGGASVRAGDAWQPPLTAQQGLASNMVNAMLQDDRGGLWFGSYEAPAGGVSRLSASGQWQRWTMADGLPHANITSFCQDQEGRVWAGSGLLDRGGAICFEATDEEWRLTKVLTQQDGLAGEKVRALFCDREGRLWFGSEYDGVAVQGQRGWRIYRENDGLSHPEVKAIAQDGDGNIWLGTRSGITRLAAEILP
ncbi:MAG: transcriptional regulator [Planctomycetota bacterium]|nr:transcriptional regulator [Planctomycetota bacterium]